MSEDPPSTPLEKIIAERTARMDAYINSVCALLTERLRAAVLISDTKFARSAEGKKAIKSLVITGEIESMKIERIGFTIEMPDSPHGMSHLKMLSMKIGVNFDNCGYEFYPYDKKNTNFGCDFLNISDRLYAFFVCMDTDTFISYMNHMFKEIGLPQFRNRDLPINPNNSELTPSNFTALANERRQWLARVEDLFGDAITAGIIERKLSKKTPLEPVKVELKQVRHGEFRISVEHPALTHTDFVIDIQKEPAPLEAIIRQINIFAGKEYAIDMAMLGSIPERRHSPLVSQPIERATPIR